MTDNQMNDTHQGNRLIQAARNGDLRTVEELITIGIDPDWHGESSPETALCAASQAGHTDVVRLLLKHGAEVNLSINSSNTALTEASLAKHWDLARSLLDHGANPLQRDSFDDRTSVWLAASYGKSDILRFMLETASDETNQNQIIKEIMLGAASGGNLSLINEVDQRVDVNCRGASGETPLMEAGSSGNVDAIRFLLAKGADVHMQDDMGNTALNLAAGSGNATAVKILIDAGSDIHHRNQVCTDRCISNGKSMIMRRFGYSVLEDACASGNTYAVEILIDAGLDVNEPGWEGRTPLMLTRHPKVAELLLCRGAELEARDPVGWTALMHSAWQGNIEIMEVLLSHGADVNVQDLVEKWTPLIAACASDIISIMDILGQKKHGRPLTDRPTLSETVKLLVEGGADVNRADVRGRTAAWHALNYKCLDIVEFLIEKGARTDIGDDFKERLHQAAIEQERSHLIELLNEE